MKRLGVVLLLTSSATGCISATPVRHVPVPARCEAMLRLAADSGFAKLNQEGQTEVTFCQQQIALDATVAQVSAAEDQARAARRSYRYGLALSVISFVISTVAIFR